MVGQFYYKNIHAEIIFNIFIALSSLVTTRANFTSVRQWCKGDCDFLLTDYIARPSSGLRNIQNKYTVHLHRTAGDKLRSIGSYPDKTTGLSRSCSLLPC